MKLLSALLVSACICLTLLPLPAATERMPLDEVKPGMTGIGITVFDGTTREEFKAHILGVLRNSVGPRRNLIIARLEGGPLAETGVIQGMSGSPIYIDERLVGAVSYSLGSFSKEPIAGITPIDEMVEIASAATARVARGHLRLQMPVTQESLSQLLREAFAAAEPFATRAGDVQGIGLPGAEASQLATLLRPIATPVVMSGFEPEVANLLAGAFRDAGFVTALGGGTMEAGQTSDAPLEPGDAVGVGLIQGDLSMAGTGTVTMVDGEHVYAFGHPFYNVGPVRYPMMRAAVQALLPSLAISSKIAAVGEVIGTIEQDRATAVYGRLGTMPALLPVTVTLEAEDRGRTDRFEFHVVDDPLLTPVLAFTSVLNVFFSHERELGASTYVVKGTARLQNHPHVVFEDIFSGAAATIMAAQYVAGPLTSLMNNEFENVAIDGVDLAITSTEEPRTASIERIWIDEVRPRAGQTIPLKILMRTYRGTEIVESVPVALPPHAVGRLRILVTDGTQLAQRERQEMRQRRDARSIGQMIEALNTAYKNNRVYVRLVSPDPGAVIRGETLSSLPPSVLAVLESEADGGSYTPISSATLGEWEIASDHFVTGARQLIINVEPG